MTVRVVKRCSDDDSICATSTDCPTGDCESTCNCNVPGEGLCEITGPTHEKRCLTTMEPCDSEADCPSGQTCLHFFGPPAPLVAQGLPVCVTSYFDGDLSGIVDFDDGSVAAATTLRARVHHGIALETPCPTCGTAAQSPVVGETYTCGGGPNDGEACTVDAFSTSFGGVSSDCPPDASGNVSGIGEAVRLRELTTATTTRTAVLPCPAPLAFHPSNGNAFCLDDPQTSCSSNADCSSGTTCGLYCHCGYCDGDADLPCFGDAGCPPGSACEPGVSTSSPAAPQQQPNLCSSLVCGEEEPERCGADTVVGACSEAPYRSCSLDGDCEFYGAGVCNLSPRPCFENTITRHGLASALGGHCVDDPGAGACASDEDCEASTCVEDTASPALAALFCMPPTTGPAVNSSFAIPGPGTVSLETVLIACRCGDGEIGCDEQCEAGNDVACPGACDVETCLCNATGGP
jgi:hypothetical protein